jgi:hypothetical protein
MDNIQKYIVESDSKLATLQSELEAERQKWRDLKRALTSRIKKYQTNDIYILKSLLKYYDPRYKQTKVIIPGGYPEEGDDIFEYAEEFTNEDIKKMVMSFKDRYRCGVMEVKLQFCEERKGYKGEDTVFTEIDDIKPVNPDKILFDKCTLADFGRSEIYIAECTDVDWGDRDDTCVSASYEIEVMWIQPIFPE